MAAPSGNAQLSVEVRPSGINETTILLQSLKNEAYNTTTAIRALTDAFNANASKVKESASAHVAANNQVGMSVGELALRVAGYTTLLTAGIAITRDVINETINLGKEAVITAASFEKARMTWGVLVGDMKEGAQVFQDLYAFSVRTPLTFESVGPAAQMLKAFGVEVKDLIPTLEMLGNIAMGDNQKLQLIAKSYGEMFASAHVQARNLIQMVRDGVPIYDALAESMHTSVGAIAEMTQKGQLTFKEVNDAIKLLNSEGHQFNGMMDTMAESLSGKWAIAVDKFKAVLASIGNEALPGIKNALDDVSAAMDKVLVKSSAQLYLQTGKGDPEELKKQIQAIINRESKPSNSLYSNITMPGATYSVMAEPDPMQLLLSQINIAQSLAATSVVENQRIGNVVAPPKPKSQTELTDWQKWFENATGIPMLNLTGVQGAQLYFEGLESNIAEFDKLGIDKRKDYFDAIQKLIEKMIESGLWVASDASIKYLDKKAAELAGEYISRQPGQYAGTPAAVEAITNLFPVNSGGIGNGLSFKFKMPTLAESGTIAEQLINEYGWEQWWETAGKTNNEMQLIPEQADELRWAALNALGVSLGAPTTPSDPFAFYEYLFNKEQEARSAGGYQSTYGYESPEGGIPLDLNYGGYWGNRPSFIGYSGGAAISDYLRRNAEEQDNRLRFAAIYGKLPEEWWATEGKANNAMQLNPEYGNAARWAALNALGISLGAPTAPSDPFAFYEYLGLDRYIMNNGVISASNFPEETAPLDLNYQGYWGNRPDFIGYSGGAAISDYNRWLQYREWFMLKFGMEPSEYTKTTGLPLPDMNDPFATWEYQQWLEQQSRSAGGYKNTYGYEAPEGGVLYGGIYTTADYFARGQLAQTELPSYASLEEYNIERAQREDLKAKAIQDYWAGKYPTLVGVETSNYINEMGNYEQVQEEARRLIAKSSKIQINISPTPQYKKLPSNLSDQYNTILTPEEESQYQIWLARIQKELGRDLGTNDYDMRGYWKKYAKDGSSNVTNHAFGIHFTDEFKKPNHMTFSSDSIYSNASTPGGQWIDLGNDNWIYAPSGFVMAQHSEQELTNYFNKYEPTSKLVFPKNDNNAYFSPYPTKIPILGGGQLDTSRPDLFSKMANVPILRETEQEEFTRTTLKPWMRQPQLNYGVEPPEYDPGDFTKKLIEQRKVVEEVNKSFNNLAESMLKAAGSAGLKEFEKIGEVLAGNKDAAKDLGDSMRQMMLDMLNALPQMLLEAGLKLIIHGDPASAGIGIALIVASGIVAIGAGAANYASTQETVSTPVPNAFGNVYPARSLMAYENGVYNTPHYFSFAKGGVFGEAGYEAIMPLTRSVTGQLGVHASVAPVNIQVVNNVGAQISTKETTDGSGQRQLQILIDKAVVSAIARGKADGSMKARYGTQVLGAQRM